jgi:hypothetical protein
VPKCGGGGSCELSESGELRGGSEGKPGAPQLASSSKSVGIDRRIMFGARLCTILHVDERRVLRHAP